MDRYSYNNNLKFGKMSAGAKDAEREKIVNQLLQVVANSSKEIKPDKEWSNSHSYYCGRNYGGFPMYCRRSDTYIDISDSHTLIIGATGSMKTRRLIVPGIKLLSRAGESMIVADPKAELFEYSAKTLDEQGYEIYVLNFREPLKGDCWNPLYLPYKFLQQGDESKCCELLNDFVNSVIKVSGKDPYWDCSARDLLFGLCLMIMKISQETGECNSIHIGSALKLRAELVDEKAAYILRGVKKWPLVYNSLLGTLTAPESKTRPSIFSTFDQHLRIFSFSNDLIEMMSQQTIELDNFSDPAKKVAIFLIMPDEKTTYHPLISLFIKQSYEYLIFLAQKNNSPFARRINYVLDEFSSLPAIHDFPAMITASRSRRIRFYLAIQSNKQLEARYDAEAETIKSNCNNWIFLTSKELAILRELSELCGNVSENKPLHSAFQLQHLNKNTGEALLLLGRNYPFITTLQDIEYYGIKEQKMLLTQRPRKPVSYIEGLDSLLIPYSLYDNSINSLEELFDE